MSLHKVRIDDVYVKDFYHNSLNTISVCIDGTILDDDGRRKLEQTNGKVSLEYDSNNFTFPIGADIVKEMYDLKNAFLKHQGRVINLECQN